MSCYFTYIVARDYGFAPNPFCGICTLATCKPSIRKSAKIGDWIIGRGSQQSKCRGKLIYTMKVTEKLNFNQYWKDKRFLSKKPIMNGSLKKMYGDNIYHTDIKGKWIQEDSHHSLEKGVVNCHNLQRDTKSDQVLISSHFFYFGRNCINIPKSIREHMCKGRAFKFLEKKIGDEFIVFLEKKYKPGYVGDPLGFDGFQRYDGKK